MLFNINKEEVLAATRQVKMLLLDVDGVLTDGKLYFSNSGEELKAFSTLDGHGIKMLQKAGIEVGIITGRKSALLERRALDLGIGLLIQGREDKDVALAEILAERDITSKQIAYVGDDFPDLPVLKTVGVGFSVPAGHADVKSAVAAITEAAGGAGAVREITDFILHSQNLYSQFLPE